MSTTAVRIRRRLALAAILLALLALAAAWLLRPRQDAVHTKTIEGPAGLSEVKSAIDEARNKHWKGLLLGVQFTTQGGAVTPCPKGATEAAANAIKHAPMPVTVLVQADQLGMPCAQAFGAQFEQCVGTGALKSCISRPRRSGSFWKTLLALVVFALLAAVAWGLLRRPHQPISPPPPPGRPRQPIPPPPPPEGPEQTQLASPPDEPTPEWRQAVRPPTGHPLAERLRYPQPAEVRSVLDPAGFVAFEGGLWRAAWDDQPPSPAVGTWVLVQYDEPTAQLVARSGR